MLCFIMRRPACWSWFFELHCTCRLLRFVNDCNKEGYYYYYYYYLDTGPQKLKLLIRNYTTTFSWYDYRWPWRYFRVIRLFDIKFVVNVAWYGKSYYRLLIENHTRSYDWCYFWWPWRTLEGHFSLGCHFHVQYLRNMKSSFCNFREKFFACS